MRVMLALLIVLIRPIIGIVKMIVSHVLACKKFTTIQKAFPNASLEEISKASKILSSIDKNGK